MRPSRRTARHLLTATVAAVLAVTLLPATPASARRVTVDRRFFGVHDADLTSWPQVPVGSVRLWDAGVTWREIETSPGVYDFTKLDAQVRAANARGAEVTLVLGMTPDFYATRGEGKTSMPVSLGVWNNYVRAVVTRYSAANWGSRGIAAYQVWNEVNVTGYWTGTPYDMALLTKATWNTVKSVDPGALVLSPAFATRIREQIDGMRGITKFAFAQVNHVPAWRYTNAISLNLYPLDHYGSVVGTPEKSMQLLRKARKILGYGGMPAKKPIWNTEINYGMPTGSRGGTGADALSPARQAAYVLRTLLLNAANKVRRVDWYAYDMGYLANGKTLGNTRLSDPGDRTTPTVAGRAFALAQAWMMRGNARLVGPSRTALPCAKDRNGTYTCVITYAHGVRRVYWNPDHRVHIRVAKSATYKVGVYGARTKIDGGSRLRVNDKPVMVRSKH